MKNVIFVTKINRVGGIETWLYEIAKAYGRKNDITVMYEEADMCQLDRLKPLVRCIKWDGSTIKCEKFIIGYAPKILLHIEAETVVMTIHADYEKLGIPPLVSPKISRYIAVSSAVAESYERLTGIKPDVIYNPFTKEKSKKALRLITASRLTKEKGMERMKLLAEALHEKNIPFLWTVFTDSKADLGEGFIKLQPRLDIKPFMAASDYLVQLSDSEGYCYSVREALALGVPAIVTPVPSFAEMGVVDGENGYIVPFDMQEIPVKKIAEKIPKVKAMQEQPSSYEEIFAPGNPDYHPITVEALPVWQEKKITDAERGRIPRTGERWIVSEERLAMLLTHPVYGAMVKEVSKK